MLLLTDCTVFAGVDMKWGDAIWMCSVTDVRIVQWETCSLCEYHTGRMQKQTMDQWCKMHAKITPQSRVNETVAMSILHTFTCDNCKIRDEGNTPRMKKLQLIQLAKHNNGAGSTVYVKGGFHLFKTGKDHALNLLRDSQTPNAKLLLVKDDVYLVIIRDVITTDEITISYENNMSF